MQEARILPGPSILRPPSFGQRRRTIRRVWCSCVMIPVHVCSKQSWVSHSASRHLATKEGHRRLDTNYGNASPPPTRYPRKTWFHAQLQDVLSVRAKNMSKNDCFICAVMSGSEVYLRGTAGVSNVDIAQMWCAANASETYSLSLLNCLMILSSDCVLSSIIRCNGVS